MISWKQDGYFIRIRIIRLNKHLDFPLASKINEDGVRDFTNDMSNEIIYIDKVGLDYLVTYHEAEFEVLDGYFLMRVETIQPTTLLTHYTISD